jgi:hypothetical protein
LLHISVEAFYSLLTKPPRYVLKIPRKGNNFSILSVKNAKSINDLSFFGRPLCADLKYFFRMVSTYSLKDRVPHTKWTISVSQIHYRKLSQQICGSLIVVVNVLGNPFRSLHFVFKNGRYSFYPNLIQNGR